MKYRKKPVVIEAFIYDVDERPKWFQRKVLTNDIVTYPDGSCYIKTLEGEMKALTGDYIIKGIQGEIYPCKPDIFLKTYEAVE